MRAFVRAPASAISVAGRRVRMGCSAALLVGLAFYGCAPSTSTANGVGADANDGGDDVAIDGSARNSDAATSSTTDPGASDAEPSDAANDSTDPVVTLGAKDRFLLLGTIVTPEVTLVGAVLVEQNMITCVDTAAVCSAKPNASGATIIDTKGIIAPGLVDTHNHILFDIFNGDDWLPSQIYQDHDQWPSEPKYQAMLDVKQCLADDSQGKPTWCAQSNYGTAATSLRCEMDKWGELKGLIAGTTSIVGLPGTSAACFGSLARSIDVAQNGLGSDKIQTSAIFPPSNPDGVCANFASGAASAFLVHVGEGTDQVALDELTQLQTISTNQGCLLAPQTSITHGVAFGAPEFQKMAAAGTGLTWSPHSNVTLYHATANIPLALAAGVAVALAPDWSMGGSQNLLEEIRFARDWDKAHFGAMLTSKDLVRMSTSTPAKFLGLGATLGSLAPGLRADIAVFTGDPSAPYDAIVASTPSTVRLVMVDGVPLYGDASLVAAGPTSPGCEMITPCASSKFLCVATSATTDKLNQSMATIKSALETALTQADSLTPGDGYNFAPLAPLYDCK